MKKFPAGCAVMGWLSFAIVGKIVESDPVVRKKIIDLNGRMLFKEDKIHAQEKS
jgi:hypothetical protein